MIILKSIFKESILLIILILIINFQNFNIRDKMLHLLLVCGLIKQNFIIKLPENVKQINLVNMLEHFYQITINGLVVP